MAFALDLKQRELEVALPISVFERANNAYYNSLAMIDAGATRDQILAETGQSIGVFDAHFDIQAGEIFVIMRQSRRSFVERLKGEGLDAVETRHPSHDPDLRARTRS